jgi:hypothetical protein
LADGAITSAKIADGTILLQDLAANSVDASKLTDGAVTVNKHADNSVSTVKIIDGAVTTTKIADLSVTNVKIADGSITTAKLGAGSVTLEKVAANAIDRSKLHPSVQASLRRPPEIYDQLVSPNYAPFNTWGVYGQLLPIDIENLGNDADGCRIVIIGKHRSGWGLTSYDAEWNVSEVVINLGQSGMNDNGEITSGQYIMGDAKWTNDNGVYHDYFFLGITDLSWGYEAWHYVGNSRDSWYQLRTYYPGSLASQLAAPWNANQQNNASNSAAGGPPVDMNINSVTAENGVVTVVTRTGHAIQKTDVVTIAGVTGAGGSSLPDPNGQRTVTAVPSRNSFQFALAGANGTYTGGWVPTLDGAGFERLPAAGYQVVPGYAKVTYKPTYSKYRLWLSVHRNTSARVIVYDN